MRKYIRPDAMPRAITGQWPSALPAKPATPRKPRRKLVVLYKRSKVTRLVIETVTLTTGQTRYLVTRRGDLAVLFDAPNIEAARAYIISH